MPTLARAYAVAESLAFGRRMQALRHGPVRARWSENGSRFWYATSGADGLHHVVVDTEPGAKRSLFDRDALAEALGSATNTPFEPGALALSDVRLENDGETVRFETAGACWRWSGARRALTRLRDAFGAGEVAAPDGSMAVSLDGPNLRLRAAGAASHRALTTDGEVDHAWGAFIDFISQVAIRRAPSAPRPLALWSPDSKRFAVVRADLTRVRTMHLLQSTHDDGVRPKVHEYRYPLPGDPELARCELWFFDRDGGRVRAQLAPLESPFASPLLFGHARWTDDGRHLLLLDSDRTGRHVVLWRIDPTDGTAVRLVEESGPAIVRASPSLAEPAIFHLLPDGRVLWWSQRDGWGHLYLIAQDGTATQLTRGAWQVRAVLHVDAAREQLVIVGGGREAGVDPYFNFAYRLGFDGSEPVLLTPEMANHQFVYPGLFDDGARSVSPCGRWLIDVHSTVQSLPVSELRDYGRRTMALETAAPADPWPAALPLPEPFTVRSLDGQHELWGLLYRPSGFDAERKYPVVEVIYGAPQTAVVNKGWLPSILGSFAEQLAALGFVVVVVDGPGTPYRSHAFQLASHGRIESCGGLPDHVHAIRTLAAKNPWMDMERVGIVGGSGGGYATVRAMAEFPAFYRVGVAMCGNHDQAAYIAGWGETYHGEFETELYARQSNVGVADRITGDLLLIHGEMDENVHPSMTLRVADAMIRANRAVDMLIVPNAGHDLATMPYVRRRTFDWFVGKLMRRQPPRPPRAPRPR